jgi:serine/threonine-protein kinase
MAFCPFTGKAIERAADRAPTALPEAPTVAAAVGIPEEIAGYSVERVLGDGAHGVVYAAHDPHTFVQLAIKLLHPKGALDPIMRQRFDREIAAACELIHPHVVRMLDTGTLEDGRQWLAMELVEGESLRAKLHREKIVRLPHAVAIASAVLSALEAAHGVGIVHRDVKPENVLLHKTEGQIVPKLADFGLARRGGPGITAPGLMLGTPRYLSPEQAKGRPDVDHRADIWAVGIMLFEMLTGTYPFDGKDVVAIAIAVVSNPVPRPRSINPQIPQVFEDIILRALQKDPAHRFQSAREMRMVLKAAGAAPQSDDAGLLEAPSREEIALSDTQPPPPPKL